MKTFLIGGLIYIKWNKNMVNHKRTTTDDIILKPAVIMDREARGSLSGTNSYFI